MLSARKRAVLALIALTITLVAPTACAPQPALAPTLDPSPAPTATPTAPPPTATASPTLPADPDPTATPPPTATPLPPAQIGPDDYPPGVNPLTGLAVDDPAVLDRRPLLIKISNSPEIVRPQSCLNSADLIFEYYVEGGWTRFAALFYSQDCHHVGSVRSARLADLQIAPAFDAILVFSGGSMGVVDTIRASDLYPWNVISPQFGYGEPWFVRFPREGLALEHTLFTDTTLLWELADEREVRRTPSFQTPGLAFHAVPPEGGLPAASARLDYARTSVEWRYDPVSGRYLRWTDGIPHTDALTGEQLAFENVIVIGSYLEEIELFPEKYFGAEKSLYIELTGSGPATLLRDGQAFDGRWVRDGEDAMFTFLAPDGSPLLLKPGRTFFQVIRSAFETLVTAS